MSNMKVYYHGDADGECSAAIVAQKHKTEQIDFVRCQYGMNFDFSSIDPSEKVYILDFSFKPDDMKLLLEKSQNVVWIDHHATAMEYDYGCELAGVRKSGVAACQLTWDYCFPGKKTPRSVELIADNDVWSFVYGDDTKNFVAGFLMQKTFPEEKSFWFNLFRSDDLVNLILRDGRTINKFQKIQFGKYSQAYGHGVTFEGMRCQAVNIRMGGSRIFGELEETGLYITYVFNGEDWLVSLYSVDPGIDAGKLAQKYGGGGHKGAAGFSCKQVPWRIKP